MTKLKPKQVLSLLLAIIMVISLLPMTAVAQEQTADNEISNFSEGAPMTNGSLTAETTPEFDENCVAEVNGVGYTDLQEAIDAANSGDTVTLLKDVEYHEKIANGFDVTISKTLTLNLGEHWIRDTLTGSNFVENGVPMTIGALKIKAIDSDITVTINATTGGISTASTRYAIHSGNGTTYNSNVTINGGNYIGGDICIKQDKGTLTITDGNFEVTSKTYPNQYVLDTTDSHVGRAKFNITGGRFKGFNPACCYVDNRKRHDHSHITDGYTGVLGEDGWYTVMPGERVAKTGYWCYSTLADAINKINISKEGNEILVITDYAITAAEAAAVIEKGLNVYKDGAEPTLPEGYIWDENNKLVVAPAVDYVAEAYGTKFTDLQEAIDAADDGWEIHLRKDITCDKEIVITKSLELYLGDYTITSTVEGASALRIYNIDDDDTSVQVMISAEDGGITAADGSYVINSGNIDASVPNIDYVKTNLWINGGHYETNGTTAIYVNNGCAQINRGSFKSSFGRTVLNGKRWYGAEFAINGGSFYGFNPACVSVWTGFDGNNYDNFYHQHDILAEGMTTEYADGWYTVVNGTLNAGAKTKSLCYPTVSVALQAIVDMKDVANLGTITLLDSAELTETDVKLAIENNFSFVPNGNEMTLPGGYELYNVTLENGTKAAKIKKVVVPEDSDIIATESVKISTAGELNEFLKAGESKIIVLTADIAYDSQLDLALADGCILDLNGYTLTLPKAGVDVSGKNITIKNGTIACSHKKPQYLLYIAENTTATIESVTIERGAIYANNGADLTLEKNTIKPWASGNASAVYANGANVTVKDGTFAGSTQGIFKEAYGGEITIYGGRYDRKNASYKVPLATFVAEGYEVVRAKDGVYKYEVKAN